MKIQGFLPMPRQTSHTIVPQDRSAQPKPVRPRDPVASGERDAAQNRAASHNYFLLEKFEAGVALRGTEVKSIREGKANLKDAYGLIKDGEAFLLNVHIGPYSHGNIANHDETRTRKLLMHREEVRKLQSKTQIKGHTLIPTRLYFRKGRVKCELALAKGKQDWDKRETERRREADRDARSAINANKHRMGH
jgi:SsrA-binding protein